MFSIELRFKNSLYEYSNSEGYRATMDENGLNCLDKNECILGHTCHKDATCTNNDGGFTCSCKTGYEGDGRACRVKNECTGGFRQLKTSIVL